MLTILMLIFYVEFIVEYTMVTCFFACSYTLKMSFSEIILIL
jgi:hypothetical protein